MARGGSRRAPYTEVVSLAYLTTHRAWGPWVRGRLHMADIGPSTPAAVALDVLTVVVMEIPVKALDKWRMEMAKTDQLRKIKTGRIDRSQWGRAPEQQEAMRRLT